MNEPHPHLAPRHAPSPTSLPSGPVTCPDRRAGSANPRRLAGRLAVITGTCAAAIAAWSGTGAAMQVQHLPTARAAQLVRTGAQTSFTDATVQRIVVAAFNGTTWVVEVGGPLPRPSAPAFDSEAFDR